MDSIALFLRDLNGCPRFTKEEERALAGRFATADEAQEAREQLIMSCAPYAFALSKPYWRRGLQQEDIIQYAMVGLMDAVDHLDPSRGRLMTLVGYHVRRRILLGIANESYSVRLPCATFWRQPGTDQVKAEKVREGIASLDSGSIDPEDERSLQADDMTAEETIWLDECREALEYAMGSLTDREQRIIRLRKAGFTMAAIGRQLSITRQRVQQLNQAAVHKMQQSLECAGVA